MDPVPEVSTLLYIGRRGWVTEIDCVPSLLQQIEPSYRLDMPALVCLDLHVGQSRQPLRASSLTAAGPIAWWWSYIRAVQVPLAHISDTYPICLVALLLIPFLTLSLSWARLHIGSLTVTVVALFL